MSEQLIESLLAQIEAAPDSLPLRQVLADALSEAGDPRGELIALQLKQRANPQLAAQTQVLWQYQLAKHRQALCGLLSADEQVSWRLGFWDELHLHGPDAVLDHPSARLLRVLTVHHPLTVPRPLRGLERLSVLTPAPTRCPEAHETPALQTLQAPNGPLTFGATVPPLRELTALLRLAEVKRALELPTLRQAALEFYDAAPQVMAVLKNLHTFAPFEALSLRFQTRRGIDGLTRPQWDEAMQRAPLLQLTNLQVTIGRRGREQVLFSSGSPSP